MVRKGCCGVCVGGGGAGRAKAAARTAAPASVAASTSAGTHGIAGFSRSSAFARRPTRCARMGGRCTANPVMGDITPHDNFTTHDFDPQKHGCYHPPSPPVIAGVIAGVTPGVITGVTTEGETAEDASGTRPFPQILTRGTRPGRVRCRFSQYFLIFKKK
eukprot:gene23801-biopygen22337